MTSYSQNSITKWRHNNMGVTAVIKHELFTLLTENNCAWKLTLTEVFSVYIERKNNNYCWNKKKSIVVLLFQYWLRLNEYANEN